MANLIDMTSSILVENTICFETRLINTEHIPVPIEDASFGILNFKATTSAETSDELDFLFVVDCSGSMSDMCSDGRTKMKHIIHTLQNMILFFNEHPSLNVYVTIDAFDVEIYHIITRTKITSENVFDIIDQVKLIYPRGSTNIEFALMESAKKINQIRSEHPTTTINHIFMTDGETTDGSNSIEVLRELLVSDVTNIFIGFGIEHDAALLSGISTMDKSAYYFIDKLENAGFVYGEILHGIVYKLVIQAEITIENGYIYNFKTNTWETNLKIGDIISESNRTFNIISSNPEECEASITGLVGDLRIAFPCMLTEYSDLTSHLYRQRTLQVLYEVKEFSRVTRQLRNFNNDKNISEKIVNLKHKLVVLMEEIKNYMSESYLRNNKFLKNLCDDICVCYRTLGTKYADMFCTSRQTSQGTQRIYTVTDTACIGLYRYLPSHRQPATQEYSSDMETQILQHEVSDFIDTPYFTPQATQVMREISRAVNSVDDEETIEILDVEDEFDLMSQNESE